jgi:ribosomal protein S18 acetylase RimI-like enzyme
MVILPLAPTHATAAAHLHIAGQPGTFLTNLGPEVLTVIYRTLPAVPVGFGFVAQADAPSTPMQGFVSATTSTGRLFWEVGTRQLAGLLPPLLKRYWQRPALLAMSMQTLLYPLLMSRSHAAAGPTAELLSIMVEPNRRGQGIGSRLLQALAAECQGRGLAQLEVTVDAANAGARRFYERHGFALLHTFQLYGRAMCAYGVAPQHLGSHCGDRHRD